MEPGSKGKGSDMATNGPDVRVYMGQYDHTAGSGRQYVWTDDAACNGVDPKYFEYNPQGSREEEIRNLEYGQTLCGVCPVAQTCLDLADAADSHFTTRGGYLPTVITHPDYYPATSVSPSARKRKAERNYRSGPEPKGECPKGHSDWRTRRDGKRYCAPCKSEYYKTH